MARHLVMELKLNSNLSQQRIRRTRRISTNKKMGKVGTMLSGTKTTEKAEVLVAFFAVVFSGAVCSPAFQVKPQSSQRGLFIGKE